MKQTLATFVTVTPAALTIHRGGSVRSAGAASGSDGGGQDATASSEDSGSSNCEVCDAGCGNGLVTTYLVLDPPGCGAQAATQFCPYGCSTGAQLSVWKNGFRRQLTPAARTRARAARSFARDS